MVKLLQTTAELARRSLAIDVTLDLDNDEAGDSYRALADANQLQQVLINLTMNARDALPQPPPGPIVYRVRQQVLPGELPAFPQNVPAGDWIVMEVEDRGAGMPPEVLGQALDPFFTTKEVGQGTGLGLPVAFGIITGHQGFLTIDSQAGKGTCVRIYLPRLARESSPGETDPSAVLEPENAPSRHILVIDDEAAVLDVVRRFLTIAGHRVTEAASGQEACAILARDPSIELAILDLMIPREEGADNFRALRAVQPRLPVLLCTGLVQSEQADELLRQGAAGVLRKPFRMNEMWYAVNRCLEAGGGSPGAASRG
jgi:CheY-like chemotaxis protein